MAYTLRIMRFIAGAFSFSALLIAALVAGSEPEPEETVEGIVVDINDARVMHGTVSFRSESHVYTTRTLADGSSCIKLKPGTYTVSVSQTGFCTLRRASFVLERHARVQFNFQLWVCPTHMEWIHYAELDEVPHTQLKPLVLFGETSGEGDRQRFTGPTTNNDGTGHPRRYPAVFSFNLLTVQAEELVYDRTNHVLTALGNVVWQAGNDSGAGAKVEIKLDGLKAHPNRQASYKRSKSSRYSIFLHSSEPPTNCNCPGNS